MKLILFGTSACHLCEQAEGILSVILNNFPQIELEHIDIAEHDAWQEKYAIRIPVLYHEKSQKELGWLFDEHDVKTFIDKLSDD